MNDIFFVDRGEEPAPPGEVRIRTLEMVPQPDGRRVRVRIEITPFEQKPNLELVMRDRHGELVADFNVIEAIDPKMEFTLHLRAPQTQGSYTARLRVYYSALDDFIQDENAASESPAQLLAMTSQEVDAREIAFVIEG